MNRADIVDGAKWLLTPEHAELFVSSLTDAAMFSRTEERSGGSYLGGHPTVAIESWPTWKGQPLSFVACIDLADVAGMTIDLDLPVDGTLSFFYATDFDHQPWGMHPEDRGAWSVLYTRPGEGSVVAAPDGAESFPQTFLRTDQGMTLPDRNESVLAPVLLEAREDLMALYADVVPSYAIEGKHQLGGWPAWQQHPGWRHGALGLQGIEYERRRDKDDAEVAQLLGTVDDWQLLFQLDTDHATGWHWADGGSLFFTIRKRDLAARRFDRCWLTLQC